MERHSTEILRFEAVEDLFRYYLAVWPNDIPLNWARVAWKAVDDSGRANYSTTDEELSVHSYAVALALIYYEFCHRSAWHEDRSFRYCVSFP